MRITLECRHARLLELPRNDGAAPVGGLRIAPLRSRFRRARQCNLFWFDKLESVRLTPRSVLEVFAFHRPR